MPFKNWQNTLCFFFKNCEKHPSLYSEISYIFLNSFTQNLTKIIQLSQFFRKNIGHYLLMFYVNSIFLFEIYKVIQNYFYLSYVTINF